MYSLWSCDGHLGHGNAGDYAAAAAAAVFSAVFSQLSCDWCVFRVMMFECFHRCYGNTGNVIVMVMQHNVVVMVMQSVMSLWSCSVMSLLW